jgi:hypothetical protein
MINMAADFTDRLYDMEATGVREFIDKNSSNDFVYIFMSYTQLRRGKNWFREQCRNVNNSWDIIRREILCEWSPSNDVNPFTEEQISIIESYVEEPTSSIMLQQYYELLVYRPLVRGINYIVTVDVAGGLKKDSSAIIFNHPDTLDTVAIMENNKIDTSELGDAIIELHEMFPDIIIVVERNSYGLAIIQRLEKLPELKKSLFYTESSTKAEKLSKTKTAKKTYGINTTGTSRDLMIECVKMLVTDHPECLLAKRIVDEIKTMEVKKTGKIEHASGEHDDAVLAKSFALYVKNYHWATLKRFMKCGRATVFNAMKRIAFANRRSDAKATQAEKSAVAIADSVKNLPGKTAAVSTPMSRILSLNGRRPDLSVLSSASSVKPINALENYLLPKKKQD